MALVNKNNSQNLAKDISNIIKKINKGIGSLGNSIDFEVLIGAATFGSDKEITIEVKSFLKHVSKELILKYSRSNFSNEKAFSIYENVKMLVSKIEFWRKSLYSDRTSFNKDNLYEYINIVGIFESLRDVNKDIVLAMGKERSMQLSRYNHLDNPDSIFNNICYEFVFFSRDNADKFLYSLEVQGLDYLISDIALESSVIPIKMIKELDKKASNISSTIINSMYISDSECENSFLERAITNFNICSGKNFRAIISEGEISKLFVKTIIDIRTIAASMLVSGKDKDASGIKNVITYIFDSLLLSKWKIVNDRNIEKIKSKCRDVILSRELLSDQNGYSLKKYSDYIFSNILKIVEESLKGTCPIYILDIIKIINSDKNIAYDPIKIGLNNIPHMEYISILGKDFQYIHNYNPYIQYSPDEVEIAPEYRWNIKHSKYKKIFLLLESESVWHCRGRVFSFANSINKAGGDCIRFPVDGSEFLYGMYIENEYVFIETLDLYINNLIKGFSLDSKEADKIAKEANTLVKVLKKYDISNIFIFDIVSGIILSLLIYKSDKDQIIPVLGGSFDLSYYFSFIFKSIVYITNQEANKEKSKISLSAALSNIMVDEMIVRPISIYGIPISKYYIERTNHFIACMLEYNFILKYIKKFIKEVKA